MTRWVLAVLAAAMMALAGCSVEESSGGGGEDSGSEQSGGDSKKKACGSRASDDCTPKLAYGKTVRVDALKWRVTGVKTASTIGDQEYGLGAKADGRFVIVTLKVTSARDESATLTDNVFQLQIGNTKYDPDNEGTTAAMGAGDEPFFLEDLGPDSTTTGKVVFDVPESKLSSTVLMRFNELGFGETHGYIRLPKSKLTS